MSVRKGHPLRTDFNFVWFSSYENRDQVTIENGSNLESGSFVDEKSLLEISCGETGAMANLFSEIDRQTEIAVQAIMAGDSKVEPASRSQIINCTVCDKTFSTTYGHKCTWKDSTPKPWQRKVKRSILNVRLVVNRWLANTLCLSMKLNTPKQSTLSVNNVEPSLDTSMCLTAIWRCVVEPKLQNVKLTFLAVLKNLCLI